MTSTDRNNPSYRNRAVGLAKIVARLGERCINPIGRISVRPRSRGGVKVPTGGNGERSSKPASARRAIGGSADSVRFRSRRLQSGWKRTGRFGARIAVSSFEARIALILVS